MKGALEVERLSLRELCEGNWKGGSFTGDPGGCVKKGSGNGHLSPRKLYEGNLDGGFLYWGLLRIW